MMFQRPTITILISLSPSLDRFLFLPSQSSTSASMSSATYHFYISRQDHMLSRYKNLVDDQLPPPTDSSIGFIIEFQYQDNVQRMYPSHESSKLLLSFTELVHASPSIARSVTAIREILCPRLSLMGVPNEDHNRLVCQTLCFAHKYGFGSSSNGTTGWLVPVVVEIVSVTAVRDRGEEEKIMQLASEKSMKMQRYGFESVGRGMDRPFMKVLKKLGLVFDGLECCGICLQRLENKIVTATWLPCSHAYHGGCIGLWFKTSPSCPTCRFQFLVH